MLWSLGVAPALPAASKTPPPTRPQIQGVFPRGGQQGAQVEVTIRGRDLHNASEIRFAASKLRAEILKAEHNLIRARFHLDSSAEPGRHDFRLIAPHGSTVSWFDVGTRPEAFEKEPNNDFPRAEPIDFSRLLNGIVKAGDYDCFRFSARAGQTLTFDINATRNGSPLDSVMSLHEESGAEIAYSDDYYQFKDAHIVHTFEKGGAYYLRVYGSGESGSDFSDYRLTAGEMPQVDHAMPMGGQRGKTVEVRLTGVNLQAIPTGSNAGAVLGDGLATAEVVSRSPQPATQTAPPSVTIRLTVPETALPGLYRLHVAGAILPAPFVISEHPEMTVPGDAARRKDDPLAVALPIVIHGVLDKPKAADYFSFRVEEPQTVVLTADSQQLNFLLDPLVAVYDDSGKRIAYQDEPTTNTGREPVNMDPHLVVHLPKAGRYTAMIRDNAYRGHPTYAYRFTIRRALPDFSLKVIGTDETLYRGAENIVTLRVRRLEGWTTPVEVWAEDLPEGVTAPRRIAEPKNTFYRNTCGEGHTLDGTNVEIPIKVPADAALKMSQIRFRARGVIEGRTVEREAYTRYWWRVNQKIMGDAQTGRLHVTIADPPRLILTAPDRVGVARGKPGTIRVIVNRFDEGNSPLEVSAETPEGVAPEGVLVEPATVDPSSTVALVKVTSTRDRPATVVLVGKTEGRVIGKSHPIVIAPGGQTAAPEASPFGASDDNCTP